MNSAGCLKTLINLSYSGLALLLLPPGASSLAAIATDVVVLALPDVDARLLLVVVLAIILHARTNAGIVTETTTATADVTGIDPVALTIGKSVSGILCCLY